VPEHDYPLRFGGALVFMLLARWQSHNAMHGY